MKLAKLFLALSVLASSLAVSAELSQQDATTLRGRVQEFDDAVLQGDATREVSLTHAWIYQNRPLLTPAELTRQRKQTHDKRISDGFTFKHRLGIPTETFESRFGTVCFVPVERTGTKGAISMRATEFYIAIRENAPNSEWQFLDVSHAFRGDPTLLKKMFPEMPLGFPVPPNKLERLN